MKTKINTQTDASLTGAPLPAEEGTMFPSDTIPNRLGDTVQVFVHAGMLRRTVAVDVSPKLCVETLIKQAIKVLKAAGLDARKTMLVTHGRQVADGTRLRAG